MLFYFTIILGLAVGIKLTKLNFVYKSIDQIKNFMAKLNFIHRLGPN